MLVLDEPTSGLDASTERGILDALRTLMSSTTTLLATHNMDLVREADEIIVLDHGRISDRGTYHLLSQRSPVFRQLVGRPDAPTTIEEGSHGIRRTESAGDAVRALFYSHNGVGVGHLQRQLDLASAFKVRHPDAAVMIATGSHAAGLFVIPSGIDYIKVPTISKVDRCDWEPRDLPIPRDDVVRLRRQLLEQTVRDFAPDLFVADFMPAGPYGELLPALDALRARGGVAIAGFRDVIDDPEFVRDLWDRTGVYDVLRTYYRSICVYGDPAMVEFQSAYGLDRDLAARMRYTGYLGRRPPTTTDTPLYERPLVIANGGGGVDSLILLRAFVGAAEHLRPRHGGTWLMVTGPLMDQVTHDELARVGEAAGVNVRRVVPELRAHVALADCVVSMAGYNTCCDVMTFRRPSVLVPRAGPSQEQRIRTDRFRQWNIARVVHAQDATPAQLASDVDAALHAGEPPVPPVSLDGLDKAVDAFDAALATSHAIA
jgi:predicted glycosyltransferase